MPFVVSDRVRDTSTTTGTGTITLSGTAPTGYQNFSVIGNTNTTFYCISMGASWEVGVGTYSSTGPTLSRDTVITSSNANALVNFAAGTKDVFCTPPSARVVLTDRTISAGTGLSGGGDLSQDRTVSLANTTVTAGSFGSATQSPTYTVNAQGRLTAAANVSIAIPVAQITDMTTVARTLNQQTTQALMRSTGLGLGTIATQNSNAVDITGGNATGLTSVSATTVTGTSDERQKTNIAPIQDALDIVLKLDGKNFDWRVSGKHDSGLIAQDVEKVMPWLVHTSSSGEKSVNYFGVIGLLVNAIKELAAK